MASNALAASGPSGPTWQVDIPGLSQLILSAGSYGLKQLACSGVDIHSIGCMLMIAEYVPASKEFRSTLNRARESQRSERLWMYKVVEIGTATNFLADQMLKTRAGENVLALMSATVPVMDEESNTSLLASLFESVKVSAENIPGTGQLQNLRKNLAPLVRKTGFRERVLCHHHWLWQILHGYSLTQNDDPYDAIPAATDIPEIIRLLHQIATGDGKYILMYNGIKGAAWVIAYACSILGFKASALDKNGDIIPIVGEYEDAVVVINLASQVSNCQLYLSGTTTDKLISLQEPKHFGRRGWSIDCSKINFLEVQHPGLTKSETFSRLSHFVAMETMSAVTAWAATFDHSSLNDDSLFGPRKSHYEDIGFKPYTMFVLPHLQERSLDILRILGFRPSQLSDYDFRKADDCLTYFPVGHKADSLPMLKVEDSEGFADESRRRYYAKNLSYSFSSQYIPSGGIQYEENERLERLQIYLGSRGQSLFADPDVIPPAGSSNGSDYASSFLALHQSLQLAVESTISNAINFASTLSFSNWNTALGVMSVRAMTGIQHSKGAEERTFEGPMSQAIELCVDGVKMIDLETRFWSQDWVALDLDGVVIFRELSRQYSIHRLRGKYLSFSIGKLLYEGQPCAKIRTDRTDLRYRNHKVPVKALLKPAPGPSQLSPLGQSSSCSAASPRFEDICTWKPRELCSRTGEEIFVRLEIMLFSSTYVVVDSSRAASNVPQVLVTNECPHGFSTAGLRNGKLDTDMKPGSWGDKNDVFEGIAFAESNPKALLYYQRTENAPIGQWLACHWNANGLRILQSQCCLRCLFQRLGALQLKQEGGQYPICIIAEGGSRISDLAIPHHRRSPSSAVPVVVNDSKGSGQGLVQELEAFFMQGWVFKLMVKTVYYLRDPIDKFEANKNIRASYVYRQVQAAFVIEALQAGGSSTILSKLRCDNDLDDLSKDWDKLKIWLLNQSISPKTANDVRSAMKRYEEMNNSMPTPVRKAHPWDKLSQLRRRFSFNGNDDKSSSQH